MSLMTDDLLQEIADLRPEWMDRAACATRTDIFYASQDAPGSEAKVEAAKRICNGSKDRAPCPVKDECLAYALRRKEPGGVWGGMTEDDRRSNNRRVSLTRRLAGCCPKCEEKTPTIKTQRGQLECLDCSTRWSPL